ETAQTPPAASAKIAEITVTGSQKHSATELAAASGIKVGDVVTKEQLQAAANRLANSGLASNVSYKYSTDSAGVHLVFDVQDAEVVPVLFDNFPWFSDEELAAVLRSSTGVFDGTAPPQGDALDKMTSALQDLLFSRGIHGRVEHALMERPDGPGQVIQFSVTGLVVKVAGITFTDPLAMKSIDVSARLVDAVGQPYSRITMLLFDYEQVRPVYLTNGYLKVTFGMPTAALTGQTNANGEKTVQVTVPITTGPKFTYSGVTWAGTSAFNDFALTSMIPLTPGSVADGNKFQGAVQKIIQHYAHTGYLDTQIDPQPQFDDAGAKVSYLMKVTEGPQYKMGNLVVTGLSLDGERRLRAAWTLAQGVPFDQDYFDAFVSRMKKPTPDVFGNIPVHYDKIGDLLRRDEKNHTVDVLLDFQ
ncbi:MAG TPA: POTRA domain-containing protein, partial [Candidatus Acidoferrum sp.]|nr:POTRA domain-containing protein [Candidatus Acidoferrum sp.]